MNIYIGLFLVTFTALCIEVTLVRLLSVTTWYHLAFFAISTAMLGMTAGAARVYVKSELFTPEKYMERVTASCIHLALSIPLSLIVLCLVPLSLHKSVMSLGALLITTAACALPFYFAGTIISSILTKCDLPIGRLYGFDLLGASFGCLFVLAGLQFMDAPSLLLLCGSISAAAGLCFAGRARPVKHRAVSLTLIAIFAIAAVGNTRSKRGIRPVIVKGERIEYSMKYMFERWNSFSRVAVYYMHHADPQLWGPSPVTPMNPIYQHHMNIDGEAATVMRRFNTIDDIEHLRYDVVNVAYHLGRKGRACIIGVGGGRDIQSAILFGHEQITGLEINPIFIDLLQGEFRDFAGVAGRPDVKLVKAEARSYLSRIPDRYSIIQISLIDTWAATGVGAYSLSENSLYTVEAWNVFMDRLTPEGILTVSRWHSPEHLGETGRVISLAAGSLLRRGVQDPRQHIALITTDNISTLLVGQQPFSKEDIERLSSICEELKFNATLIPGQQGDDPFLQRILSARSYSDLLTTARSAELNYAPTTDENPYFFNMLRLRNIRSAFSRPLGIVRGNMIATATLVGLLLTLAVLVAATIVIPLGLKSEHKAKILSAQRTLWTGAFYFSLIGAGFMLTEIALIQKLTVLLSHPIYALSILLFTIIASTGIGSLVSERLPLTKLPWLYLYPAITAACIIAERFLLRVVLKDMITTGLAAKTAVSVAVIFPMGMLMGMFFPTGMRLAKRVSPADTPWYWALNGIVGVFASAVAVFISIYVEISTNLYIAAACYLLTLAALFGLRRAEPSA